MGGLHDGKAVSAEDALAGWKTVPQFSGRMGIHVCIHTSIGTSMTLSLHLYIKAGRMP